MSKASDPPALPLCRLDWWTNEDYRFGFDLYNEGFFWEAHVYWEKLWVHESTEPEARRLLRGLIQLAAASLQSGKGRGKLLEKSRRSLDGLAPGYGVDVDSIRETLDRQELPQRIDLRLEER